MIIVPDSEGNINSVASEKRCLLQALGHVPTQGVEGDLSSQFSVLSSQMIAAGITGGDGCGFFFAPDRGAVGVAAGSHQNGDWGEFFRLCRARRREQPLFERSQFASNRGRSEFQLDVFVFQNPRGRG